MSWETPSELFHSVNNVPRYGRPALPEDPMVQRAQGIEARLAAHR